MSKYKYEKYNYPTENKLLNFNLSKDWVITSSRFENGNLILEYKCNEGINNITIKINELMDYEKI